MVFGFVGVFIGLAVGVAAGIWGGTRLFAKMFRVMDLTRFDVKADYDDKIPVPQSQGKPVPAKYRQFLQYFPMWATTPDFYRVAWMNNVMKTLWPQMNQAIGKMILETAAPQMKELQKQYPFIEAMDIELIDFGTKPMRIQGVKVYPSQDNEVVMESLLTWGSNARFRASLRLRLSKWSFYLPIELADFQLKVLSRITLKPLVDTLPCMGAVTLSLMEDPHMDFSLHLFQQFDLMLLPGMRQAATYCINMVMGDMIQYPNRMTFDIMEHGGVPPPPCGMLQVKIKKVENISAGGDLLGKVDPYVDLAVRDRRQRTRTIWNTKNPEFDEVFNLIVDDLNSQVLTIRLHDDMGFHDPVIGVMEIDLADADFVKNPRKEQVLTLDFLHPPSLKKMKHIVKKRTEESHAKAKARGEPLQKLETLGTDIQGRKQYKIPDAPKELAAQDENKKKKSIIAQLQCEVTYIPFQHTDADPTAGGGAGSNEAGTDAPKMGGTFSSITDQDKGILTVTLTGCRNLEAKDGTVDPYVVFQLEDPCSVRPEVQASSSMTNEPNPHFNTKFDFAMISATSTLRVHVYDKKSTMQNVMAHPVKTLTGNITGKSVNADEMIGSLKIGVPSVVRNDRLCDFWALQDTQKGTIMLELDWSAIKVAGIEGLEQTGDQKEVARLKEEQEKAKQREEAGEGSESKHSKHHIPFIHRHEKADKGTETDESGKKSPRHSHLHLPFTHKDKTEKPSGGAEDNGLERSGKSGILHMPNFLKRRDH